jgi:hypothetical protein
LFVCEIFTHYFPEKLKKSVMQFLLESYRTIIYSDNQLHPVSQCYIILLESRKGRNRKAILLYSTVATEKPVINYKSQLFLCKNISAKPALPKIRPLEIGHNNHYSTLNPFFRNKFKSIRIELYKMLCTTFASRFLSGH